MTEIPIVDKDDTVIGYKLREEVDLERDIVRSGSLWVTDSNGRVLLAQRLATKRTNPGMWGEAVGGTVEGSDSYEATIYREAEEELGITDVKFEIGPKQFIQGPPSHYFVQWYKVTLDWSVEKFALQDDEVQEVAWLDVDFLKQDMQAHPEKYINALPSIVALLTE